MGQHADDILNGDVDGHTGEWLGGGQGFPRSMGSFNPVNGVMKFLQQNYHKDNGVCQDLIKRWATENGLTSKKRPIAKACAEITRDFGLFKVWVANQKTAKSHNQ